MPKILITILLTLFASFKPEVPDSKRASDARSKLWPKLQKQLTDGGFNSKYELYLRIVKQTDQLEIWAKKGKRFEFFKGYNICYYSGGLGTKTKAGDNKSPEGFYTISAGQLHPTSQYHLAVNIGYPNALETQKGYTGNAIMIHGNCASVGCYAMTDDGIEEIYTLLYKAFTSGQQKIALEIYPFKMDNQHLKDFAASPYMAFWKMLKPAYDKFEKDHLPANISVANGQYVAR
ncbi:2-dehydro-3-deoxyphosphooctonate aldolase [Mucilaginibacter conchicola]|uniref:2-dehydro-3-deoxyphosphooctonate aldolase n=1 Tax=Mucilaginibacter conchicola TaxID=2303333 RepID=A0A372NZ22_9SPHI|nr:L,D-transpeptidase family protein [Mucilaginibacter conchicola]RFZ95151.1 2-dehydro-3-deoxyphosphooctonate aldolase [Mucilaginibacter conchicola]